MTAAAGKQPLVPIAAVNREYAALRDAVLPAVADVFDSCSFILGPEVTALEKELAEHVGGAHVVGCANGTDALVLALRALDIGPGDEVIVPAFTWVSTANVIEQIVAHLSEPETTPTPCDAESRCS